jgi:hypothetical protein
MPVSRKVFISIVIVLYRPSSRRSSECKKQSALFNTKPSAASALADEQSSNSDDNKGRSVASFVDYFLLIPVVWKSIKRRPERHAMIREDQSILTN